jgi:flagellar hook-associated protein 2
MSTTTSIGPTYDPTSTATALAQKYTQPMQDILTTQTKDASATGKGLTDLNSALLAYQTSLESLTGLNKTISAQSATFADTTIGTASASASATAGNYSFFVEKLATASQVSYAGVGDDSSGSLVINVGTASPITLNLGAGPMTARQLAAAINAEPTNTGLVTASIVTTGTGSELVLTAKNTGAGAITLDTTGMTGTSLDSANVPPTASGPMRVLVAGQDAIVHVGTENGTPITQASNTFTNIDGVKMTFTREQAAGSPPVTLTVGADSSATTANAQAFVDAYNKLKGTLDAMVDAGDPTKNVSSGVFAHDGGIRALRGSLVSLLRPTGSASLAAYGILAARDGTLTLNATNLARKLATDPHGLDTLIGSSSGSAPSGIAGSLDALLKSWDDSANGQLKQRQNAVTRQQQDLTSRQAQLDNQYNAAYQRYVLQFTQLQTLQSQMSSNTSMFDALFGSNQSK